MLSWTPMQMPQQYFTVLGSRLNLAEAKPFPNSPSNLGCFRLQQGLPFYGWKKIMCNMSDYSRFVIMRARSFFVMCVVFYGKRGDKFLACGPVLFKHTCNFDVKKLSCLACVFDTKLEKKCCFKKYQKDFRRSLFWIFNLYLKMRIYGRDI